MKTTRQEMIEYAGRLDTEILKDVALMAFNNLKKGADRVLQITLNELESRLSETEFVDFCETL